MIEALYEKMMIPESCRLGKRVYKRLFHENAKLSATDKKALSDDVDTILWQYTFSRPQSRFSPTRTISGNITRWRFFR